MPHPPSECPENDGITATFTHSQPAFKVAHLAAGGMLLSLTLIGHYAGPGSVLETLYNPSSYSYDSGILSHTQ